MSSQGPSADVPPDTKGIVDSTDRDGDYVVIWKNDEIERRPWRRAAWMTLRARRVPLLL